MSIKVLWYLSQADGDYPWCPGGLYPVQAERYLELARSIDQFGFYGAMLATWPNDPLVSAAFVAHQTTHMKFLVAFYSRMTPPKLLAQQALTFDSFSNGRLMLNLINGRDNIMQAYGITKPHAERYKQGIDYWRKFSFSYRQGATSNFPNTALQIAPVQAQGVQLWGTGDSPAGMQQAGELADVYLTMLREPHILQHKFNAARQAAQAHGRSFKHLGALGSVIVRPTQRQAEEAFYAMFEATGVELLSDRINESIRRRSGGQHDFLSFQATDPRRQGWLDSLRRGQLPTLQALRLDQHLYAGITAWATLDVFGTGSSAAYLVGSPGQLAHQIATYAREVGLSTLILSGWPLLQEARYTAELLLPLLDTAVDHA